MSNSTISKGKFSSPRISNFISLNRYLFIKEDRQKFLLLELLNDRDEKVTGVKLEVSQKDARGTNLTTFTVDSPVFNGNPCSSFILDHKIALAENCADFTVKILSADFGNYSYTAEESKLALSYKKNKYKKNAEVHVPYGISGGINPSVSIKSFKQIGRAHV